MSKLLKKSPKKPLKKSLKKLLEDVLITSGVHQKIDIQNIARALQDASINEHHPNGDDAAAILNVNDNGYDLIAGEGFLVEFVERDPWFAGWCSVMVNISDIAAMGGRPIAITNTIWSKPSDMLNEIYQGMSAASQVFKIPIVGGHTNLHSNTNHLAVSIYGRANKLLSSFAAKPGHVLVAAIDLRGSFREPFLNWNAATTAPANRLRNDVELLPKIAELDLALAAKDISQAGLLGTCLMLLESSNAGAVINLDAISKPEDIDWLDWLCCFPSFGYLLTTPESKLDALLKTFEDRDIAASCIGSVTAKKQVIVSQGNQTELFWDIGEQAVTGFNAHKSSQIQSLNEEVSYA